MAIENENSEESAANLPGPDPIAPLPGANSASRRRKALRDFYKLQQIAQAQESETPQDIDDSMADFIQDDESKSPLDKPGTTADDYIRNLVKDSDLKTIVKTENKLVTEIRALDSEQKALVYNNYNKLIAAANTLESMHKNEQLLQVHELKDSLNKVSIFVKQSTTPLPPTPNTATPNTEANINNTTSNTPDIPYDRIQTARWILGSNKFIESLLSANKKQEAKELANDTITLINNFPTGPQSLQDQLMSIKSKCEEVVNMT